MRPFSSGSRRASSALRGNSGSSSRNSTPPWASEISPGRGGEPPPTSATALAEWCGARRALAAGPGRAGRRSPGRPGPAAPRWPALPLRSSAAAGRQTLRQHRLAGARRADQQQAVAAGRGDLQRALGRGLALHVAQVGPAARGLRRAAAAGPPATAVASGRRLQRRAPPAAGGRRRACPAPAPVPPRRALAVGSTSCASICRRGAAASASASAPRTGRSSPASDSSPANSQRRQRAPVDLPAAARMPSAIGRSKRPDSLGRSAGARLTVMRLLCGKREAALLQRRAHPLARFLDLGVGQAHQREARQAVGQMHFDGDAAGAARPSQGRGCEPRQGSCPG